MKYFKKAFRRILNLNGYEIIRLNKLDGLQIGKWILQTGISTIIDIGSNEGQFLMAINKILPGRKIVAFEPIKECYDKLIKNTQGMDIVAFNYGLSNINGASEINISENLVSSSLLPMEKLHSDLYPESKYVKKNVIDLVRLDDFIEKIELKKNILIKIDVQGYENKVIQGGERTIQAASVVIVEYAYQPIYEGQWLFDDTYRYFTAHDFTFIGFADQVVAAESGIPIYGDAIFVKSEIAATLYR